MEILAKTGVVVVTPFGEVGEQAERKVNGEDESLHFPLAD